ncbi:MAG: sugar transferase [Chlamydiota bacterium]
MEKVLTESYSSATKPFHFQGFHCKIKHLPVKRIFDLGFSFIVLLLLSPLYLLIGIAIRLSSQGKSIYFHERIGRGGKPFRCYKFRTMYSNADERLAEILYNDVNLQDEWETCQKLKNDPRVTPIGKILRKFSLDELPQFWNVVRGDLSIVGPRPVLQVEIDKHFGSKAAKILSIRPGITGIWQVSGRSDTTYAHRLTLDERYVNENSFLLDLKLIARTIPVMFSSRGAY